MDMPTAPLGVDAAGLLAGRLSADDYQRNFADAHPPLTRAQAVIEAERCYYCYDAPCTAACPTGIDVPTFIQRIVQDNLRGAAQTILEANVLGGLCARVCPTEMLCEQACVRSVHEGKPVEIGLLQRHATDAYFANPGAPLFTRAAPTGRRVAVVGAGPAGLSAAHRLAVLGHAVVLYDARPRLGGLNEYGLATYKTTGGFARKEIEWLLSIGGIEVRAGQALGRNFTLQALVESHDAVFLGLGLSGVNALGIAEPALEGVRDAVDFIAELRQAAHPAEVAVGRQVVVIGGGMTAVDAAVQARKLGAREVHIVYRRGPADMGASAYEQHWAQGNGVHIHHWATPRDLLTEDGRLRGVCFTRTRAEGERLGETGETFVLPADMVLKAIGQRCEAECAAPALELRAGRILTDAEGRTSLARVWAGGDCRHGGRDLTVEAVEHGKQAALSIDRALSA
ncbi:NAD(P)-dependent oxidoreductase [Aquabacterium sp. A7-Y]|uniref:NAD(P)-dependent oxidoreductase n=1 Tax=Aquabacterium sp. A7-Y TaxID=1349605 RepID=UPI00223CF508|nr:NAD(P)-dependent oxidoreductase [Aquabacterium sp. A7-Y]MCW7538767.1 NAD(P)-dependent oxidoreductase [Aquabacterium sp. A7-Y]